MSGKRYQSGYDDGFKARSWAGQRDALSLVRKVQEIIANAEYQNTAEQMIPDRPKIDELRAGKTMLWRSLQAIRSALAESQKWPTPPGGWTAARERIERFCNSSDDDGDAPHFKKGKLKSWKWRDKRKNARAEKLAKVETLAEPQEGKKEERK